MLTPLDHVLFVVLAVLLPLRGATTGLRRLERAPEPERPRVRVGLYRQVIAVQWTLAIATLALWLATHRDSSALGLTLRPNGALIGILAGVVVVILIVVRQSSAPGAADERWA